MKSNAAFLPSPPKNLSLPHSLNDSMLPHLRLIDRDGDLHRAPLKPGHFTPIYRALQSAGYIKRNLFDNSTGFWSLTDAGAALLADSALLPN